MKLVTLIAIMFSFSTVFAKTLVDKAKWSDGLFDLNGVYEGDFVFIKLPYTPGSKPTVELMEDNNSECEAYEIKRVGKEIIVKFAFVASPGTRGFNGCYAVINRNHKDDDESVGTLPVQFGYVVD